MEASPAISAVVCTRDRADGVRNTVASLLAETHPDFEVLVVDQSCDGATESALAPFRADPRLRLIRTTTRGLSLARNIGAEAARASILAFTDDDCVATPTWLQEMEEAFAAHERIGVVFGNVEAGDFDRSKGRLPSYVRDSSFLARGMAQQHHIEGMGASMGIRRSLWKRLQGFDEVLGAGAPLRSGEDTDFAIRALLSGAYIFEPAKASVVHYGFRTWSQAEGLIEGYMVGRGAVLIKGLRCGYFSVLTVLLRLAWRWMQAGPVVELGPRPPRWPRLRAFAAGCWQGLLQPLDRRRGLFKFGCR